jgi:hypothetical protein
LIRAGQFWDLGRHDCRKDYDQERDAGDLCEQADQDQKTAGDLECSYEMRCEIWVREPNPREAENAL